MIMAGVKDPEQYALARKILLIMGEYFQIQDDYLVGFFFSSSLYLPIIIYGDHWAAKFQTQ